MTTNPIDILYVELYLVLNNGNMDRIIMQNYVNMKVNM